MEFKIGDIVELKSGNPKMTVKEIYDSEKSSSLTKLSALQSFASKGDILCIWTDKYDCVHEKFFNPEELQHWKKE